MTDPETYERLQNLSNLGVRQSFINFISNNLQAGKVKEKFVIDYCIEIENKAESSKFAKPKHLFSRVRGRSPKHYQFWYK